MISRFLFLIFFTVFFSVQSIFAQDSIAEIKKTPKPLNDISVSYGSKGFQFETADDRFLLQIQSRFQFRFASPFDKNPSTLNDLREVHTSDFKIRRARLKVGGHAFKPWLKYYWEYEINASFLTNYQLSIEKWKALNFKIGQWKLEYSRERRISSGKQQLVDRSIINRAFTVDRQQGVEVFGQLEGNKSLNFSYWLAVLTGTGRSSQLNNDENMMYFGRFQWNFLGRELAFVGSDIKRHEKPTGIIAIAATTNTSPYTRFSSSGGGYLEGYNQLDTGLFQVNQANIETAFMYKGFSWQSELHFKEIIDENDVIVDNTMRGYYIQAGYFFHELLDWWPKPLELAGRRALYEPNSNSDATREETTIGANWFFNGHRNKLSTELSYYDFRDDVSNTENEWRFRLQWDISF